MALEIEVVRLLTKALAAIVQKARVTSKQKQAATRISSAVKELLSSAPDLDVAESLVTEARGLVTSPTPELLRAEGMLDRARSYEHKKSKAKRKKSVRRKSRAKATRKKSARKKAVRKKG